MQKPPWIFNLFLWSALHVQKGQFSQKTENASYILHYVHNYVPPRTLIEGSDMLFSILKPIKSLVCTHIQVEYTDPNSPKAVCLSSNEDWRLFFSVNT